MSSARTARVLLPRVVIGMPFFFRLRARLAFRVRTAAHALGFRAAPALAAYPGKRPLNSFLVRHISEPFPHGANGARFPHMRADLLAEPLAQPRERQHQRRRENAEDREIGR